METTFSMFSPPSSRVMQRSLTLPPAPKSPVALTEKYRPRCLDDIVGQGFAVHRLQSFLEFPHSAAFVFSGATGTGKTSAAMALANELGVDYDWGFRHIKSGELDVEEVRAALNQLRFACPCGSGWKLIIADEADMMHKKSVGLWLSALEDLPDKSIVIFTTNHPDDFERRFLDRCEHIEFESNASTLWQDAQLLLTRLWEAERLHGCVPNIERFSKEIVDSGTLSFRRVVRAVETEMRRQQSRPQGQQSRQGRGEVASGPQATQGGRMPHATLTVEQFREIKAGMSGQQAAVATAPVVMM